MCYPTIREFAKDPACPVSELALRRMVKQNELPGFLSGNRFRINREEAIKMFQNRSMQHLPETGNNPTT